VQVRESDVLSAWCGIRPLASDPTQVHLPALTLPVTLLTPLTLFISLLHVSNMSSVYVETIRLVPPAQGEHCPQSKARKYASPALLWAAGLTTLCDGRVVSTHTHWPVAAARVRRCGAKGGRQSRHGATSTLYLCALPTSLLGRTINNYLLLPPLLPAC
jgi:glycerol-3-phosphate dehydrogenase